MRVAIVKPDFMLTGGFEFVMDRIAAHLEESGHDVVWLRFDSAQARWHFSASVSPQLRKHAPEFVGYLALIDAALQVDAHRADMVISSQPPSFAVEHRRHLSVFYHHNRIFYDLDEVARRAHLVDETVQPHAVDLVRRLDQPMLDAVTYILAGSEEVAQRLATYNSRTDRVGIFHAGLGLRSRDGTRRGARRRHRYPLCVSRHEFPKRTELFVQAMKLLPDLRGVSVGSGGRLGYVQRLDAELTADLDASAVCANAWLENPGWIQPLLRPTPGSNVEFAGQVSDDDLVARYRDSSCVVAPAYLEDYGLTALEAMAFGKPVIVCNDGGYLSRLVTDGLNGLVVDPDPHALAAAIRRIHEDMAWAEELGENGRAVAADFTWERALAEFDVGVEQVMG
jgi:glycosyltransferase involved in cell wall biosynthesis